MIEQIAKALFAKEAAERVIACVMTKDRAHMHLDTVFTMLDRDKVTAYPKVTEGIRAISLRPGERRARSTCARTRTSSPPSPTRSASRAARRGDRRRRYQQEREQWDDGNNVVALEPGVVVAYERNTSRSRRCVRPGGGRGDRGIRAGQGPRWRALHDLPHPARPDLRCVGLDPAGPWR